MPRVVVTGGAGFIGSALCRRLLDHRIEVVILDSIAGGRRVEENAAALQSRGAQFVRGDIRECEVLRAVLQTGDRVVHLAALASVPVSMAEPERCHSINVEGTRVLLAEAERAGVVRVVFASTAAVYGPEPNLPSREDDRLAPASPYAVSKLEGETTLSASAIETFILRLFNVYGPGQDPSSSYSGVITRWIDALTRNDTLELFGDGSQTRDFVHVDDIAAALHFALFTRRPAPGPLNIGSGRATSLRQLLDTLSDVLAVQPAIRYHPVRLGDVPHSRADIQRARETLGFSPQVELRLGLDTVVKAAR